MSYIMLIYKNLERTSLICKVMYKDNEPNKIFKIFFGRVICFYNFSRFK